MDEVMAYEAITSSIQLDRMLLIYRQENC